LMHRFAFHAIAESEKAQMYLCLHGNHHHFPGIRTIFHASVLVLSFLLPYSVSCIWR
jgi:hypothetical protein